MPPTRGKVGLTMWISPRIIHSLLLTVIVVALTAPPKCLPAPGRKPAGRIRTSRNIALLPPGGSGAYESKALSRDIREQVDLSRTYEGTLFFKDMKGKKYLMQSPVKLEIRSGEFTFTDKEGSKPLTGQIETFVYPERGNLDGGWIQVKGEPKVIQIRWHWDKACPDKLKLLRVWGARNRGFRFCSTTLTEEECRKTVGPCPSKETSSMR